MPEWEHTARLSSISHGRAIFCRSIVVAIFVAFCMVCTLAEAGPMSLSTLSDVELTEIGHSTDPRCGPLSLLAISRWLGVKTNIDELCRLAGLDEHGVTMLGLYQAGQAVGLSCRGMSLSIDALRKTDSPAILHLNGNHFVALERFMGKDARILTRGRLHFLSSDQLAKIWNGNALVVSRKKPEASQNGEAPTIEFEELTHSFGEAYQQEDIGHIFSFRNVGKRDLLISRVEVKCGCTVALLTDEVVPPGSSGVLRMEFNTGHRVGMISESVEICSNDPVNPLMYLTIVGFVNCVPAVVPTRIYFGSVPSKKRMERTIKVVGPARQGFGITAAETTSEHIVASVISSKNQEEAEILVTLNPDIALGTFSEKLVIHTNNEKKPRIEVPIEGEIVGEITVFPENFFFGIVSKGQILSREVEMSKAGEKNLEITSVKIASEFASIRVVPIQKGSKYTIKATLSKHVPSGTIRDAVEIYTNNSNQPIVKVPLYALIQE